MTEPYLLEDEALHSSVDGTQAHAGATQQIVELLPPRLAAIVGLGLESPEPPPERLVLLTGSTLAKPLSP